MTGAANGIGRATALAFGREGANVIVADISEKGNQETARMIEQLGRREMKGRRGRNETRAAQSSINIFCAWLEANPLLGGLPRL